MLCLLLLVIFEGRDFISLGSDCFCLFNSKEKKNAVIYFFGMALF
jgi:hypothetical protein